MLTLDMEGSQSRNYLGDDVGLHLERGCGKGSAPTSRPLYISATLTEAISGAIILVPLFFSGSLADYYARGVSIWSLHPRCYLQLTLLVKANFGRYLAERGIPAPWLGLYHFLIARRPRNFLGCRYVRCPRYDCFAQPRVCLRFPYKLRVLPPLR